ncbi:MAG: hypothetical protein WCO35_03105 [Candidatus Nomurabacteria bacterium]
MEIFNFKQSILSAGGNPESCKYISKEDLDILVKKAIYIKNRRDKFPSFDVIPVNSLEEGIELCNFQEVHKNRFLDGLKIFRKDKKLKPKKIILGSFTEYDKSVNGGLNKIFADYKLKMVENYAYYFLGLMILDAKKRKVANACRDFYLKDYNDTISEFEIFLNSSEEKPCSKGVRFIGISKKNDWKELNTFSLLDSTTLLPRIQRRHFYMLEEDV